MTFRDAAAHRALPGRTGHQPPLRLALPEGPLGQPARLRHRRLRRNSNPELGSDERLSGDGRRLARPRHGPDPGHRAQPHERDPRREPLVERRAGERPRLAARRLLRHRLAARQGGTAEQDPPAHPGRPVRAGPGIGRTEAGVPRGGVLPALLPVAPAPRPADLPGDPDAPAGRAEGNPAGGLRGPARIGEHRHRAGAPARAHAKPSRPASPNGSARRR